MAAALSPQERAFFAQAAPDAQALANFGWRYEALAVLQWALGLADTLPEPSALCAVPLAAQRALDNAQAAERTTLARRPLPELLDTLDRHLRLHWAVRQAGGRSARPADPVSRYRRHRAGVVYERHYALNWLLHFEDAEWDEVETPT